MKKVFGVILIFIIQFVYPQDIILTFDGVLNGSNTNAPLNKVLIENLTKNQSIELTETFVINLNALLNIGDFIEETNTKGFKKIYPNPTKSSAYVEFYSEGISNTTIEFYNITGQRVAQYNEELNKGLHKLKFTPQFEGVYFVILKDNGNSYFSKIIAYGNNSHPTLLSYVNQQVPKKNANNFRTSNDFTFDVGDELRYTGFYNNSIQIVYDVPTVSKTVTFSFTEPLSEYSEQVKVDIELPENAIINRDDLTLSSIFSEGVNVEKGTGRLETFKNSGHELILAKNVNGNVLLLGYLNSNDSNEIVLNAESTALSLVMMHPWVIDLSENARKEAIKAIQAMSEFDDLTLAIQTSIASGNLDPLSTNEVLDKIFAVQSNIYNRTVIKSPLIFNNANHLIEVRNEYSAVDYVVGLYNESNTLIGGVQAIDGTDLTHAAYADFLNLKFDPNYDPVSKANFTIPDINGIWNLKASNGKSGSGEEYLKARHKNKIKLIANIYTLFSGAASDFLKEKKLTNMDCIVQSLAFFFESYDLNDSINKYMEGGITGYELIIIVADTLQLSARSNLDMFIACDPKLDLMIVGALADWLTIYGYINKVQKAYNTTNFISDWRNHDGEINMCYFRSGGRVFPCGVRFVGDLDFGDVLIDQTEKAVKTIQIENISDAPVDIANFTLPDRFYIDLASGTVINVGQVADANITFEPIVEKQYIGEILAEGYEEGQVLGAELIQGVGYLALTLEGDMQFFDVPLNTSVTRPLTLTNKLDTQQIVDILFPPVFGNNLQTGVVIEPGQTINVDVVFTPTEEIYYENEIIVTGQNITSSIQVSGTGVSPTPIQITGDLNFGDVVVGDYGAKNIFIYNNSDTPMNVSSIEFVNLLNTCTAEGFVSGTIEPGQSKSTIVRFAPEEIKSYSGFLIVNNDLDSTNNTHPIVGQGIESTGTWSLSGDLNFGEVSINTSSTKSITITNNAQIELNVSSIGLPEGFVANWSSGAIASNASQNVDVTFSPTQLKDYSGELIVNNDLDQVNNKIPISASGIEINSTYEYPATGAYGQNILDRNTAMSPPGNFSIHAIIPEGKDLRVKVVGNFSIVGNSGNGWTWNINVQQSPYEVTAEFTSTQSGSVDASLLINPSGLTSIEVYEKGDTTPTWTR